MVLISVGTQLVDPPLNRKKIKLFDSYVDFTSKQKSIHSNTGTDHP